MKEQYINILTFYHVYATIYLIDHEIIFYWSIRPLNIFHDLDNPFTLFRDNGLKCLGGRENYEKNY